MRKLRTEDVFAFIRCTKAMGIKEELKETAQKSASVKDVWDNGFDLIWGLFDKATEKEGEKHLYAFLAGPFEMKPDEIRSLEFEPLWSMLEQLVKENNLADFFKRASALMK